MPSGLAHKSGGYFLMTDHSEQRIPLTTEEVFITKTQVITDHVRVMTHVDERSVVVEDTLLRGALHVKRVPVERQVTSAPEPRQEEETLIVSIVEERLVVEKRLFVVEELHIIRSETSQNVSIPETLRTMRATVEEMPPSQTSGRDSDD